LRAQGDGLVSPSVWIFITVFVALPLVAILAAIATWGTGLGALWTALIAFTWMSLGLLLGAGAMMERPQRQ
jgi:hypothetical protein